MYLRVDAMPPVGDFELRRATAAAEAHLANAGATLPDLVAALRKGETPASLESARRVAEDWLRGGGYVGTVDLVVFESTTPP